MEQWNNENYGTIELWNNGIMEQWAKKILFLI